jgi:hypothetical protein
VRRFVRGQTVSVAIDLAAGHAIAPDGSMIRAADEEAVPHAAR